MPQLTGSLVKYPARVSTVWYVGLIAVGSLLLMQSFCHRRTGESVTPLDAVFTATSAACVTGLVVCSTEHDLSFVGQAVVLVLIQLGGIGIMTVTTFVMFHLGGQESLRHRAILSETLGVEADADLKWILRNVLAVTLLFEGCGFAVLLVRNVWEQPLLAAVWQALFHSVSAFCNAGFALHDDSLTRFRGDALVNLIICTLVIVGGIGFPVILDLRRAWRRPWRDRWERLHLHSKVMLVGTGVLLTLGTMAILVLEWNGVLTELPLWQRPMVALFHAVSCRTAGFNTVSMAELSIATLFVSILLMAIGGGPCSTAGGFKVSTISVMVLRAWSTFQGRMRVSVARRTVPRETVERATATAMLFLVIAVLAVTSLLISEPSERPHVEPRGLFLDTAFEAVSALGTVGLSTGMTPFLTVSGRAIVIVLMFVGRLGPISVLAALSRSERSEPVEFASESPFIG